MSAIARFWQNFARWVKHGHARPLPIVTTPATVESWAARKSAFELSQRAHRDQREAGAKFRKATNAALIEEIFAKAVEPARIVETHPWLIRDPEAFTAAVKATARRRVEEARR